MNVYTLSLFSALILSPLSHATVLSSGPAAQDITSDVQIAIAESPDAAGIPTDFQSLAGNEIRLAYTTRQLWMKVTLQNPEGVEARRVLYLSAPLTGTVRLLTEDGRTLLSGSSVPIARRAMDTRLTAFPVSIPALSSSTFYIARSSHHSLATRVLVAEPEAFQDIDNEGIALLFFYLGGIVCLVIYNLFVGLYARDVNFLIYSIFALTFAATVSCVNGADGYFFRNLNFAPSHYLMAVASSTLLAALAFVYRFLAIGTNLRWARWLFITFTGVAVITFLGGLFDGAHLQPLGFVIDANIVLTTVSLMVCAFVVYWRGYVLAKFLVWSWMSVLTGVILWFSMMVGFLPQTFVTQHALLWGNLGEMLIISFGLAYKINILDQKVRMAAIEVREKERYHLLVKVLSHDIGHLLQVAEFCVARLKDSILGGEDRELLNRLSGVIERVRQTLGFVREEERLKASQKALSLSPVDLSEAVTEVARFFAEPLREKGLQLKVQVAPGSFVLADRNVLTNQVISNILANALKYSRPSGEIRIECEEKPNSIRLQIRDRGIGIREEQLREVFFSGGTVSTRGTSLEAGSGMGASLAREYMKLFNGEIEVSSVHESMSKESGTTVCLCFPKYVGSGQQVQEQMPRRH